MDDISDSNNSSVVSSEDKRKAKAKRQPSTSEDESKDKEEVSNNVSSEEEKPKAKPQQPKSSQKKTADSEEDDDEEAQSSEKSNEKQKGKKSSEESDESDEKPKKATQSKQAKKIVGKSSDDESKEQVEKEKSPPKKNQKKSEPTVAQKSTQEKNKKKNETDGKNVKKEEKPKGKPEQVEKRVKSAPKKNQGKSKVNVDGDDDDNDDDDDDDDDKDDDDEDEDENKKKASSGKKPAKKKNGKDVGVNLQDLDVIIVPDDESDEVVENTSKEEEELDDESVDKKKKKKPQRDPFDVLPDETIANILSYLSEVDTVRAGQVCTRFNSVLNEDVVWEPKTTAWKNVTLATDIPTSMTGKQYYVSKFLENERRTADLEKQRIAREKQQRREDRRDNIVQFMMYTYFRFQGLEIPVVALFSIFSLLINLRADNYIECSYHLVFLPVYIAHLHVFMCLFLGDFLNGYFDYVGLQPDWKIKSLFGALTKDMALGWCTKHWWDSCDRMLFVVAVLMPWLVVMWILLFTWAKAEEVTTFSWWVAFSPWWIIAICVFFPLGTAWIFIWFNIVGGSERLVALRVAGPCTIALICLTTWFALVAWNQEQYIRDLPTWPWTLVSVPLFAFEIGMLGYMVYFASLIG